MNRLILLCSFCICVGTSYAQPISRQSIEDSVIGWIKVYNFKGIKESKKVDDKLYSAAQLSLCDSFANWIQASYIPKGGLGDVKKTVSEKLGLYNQHTAGQPQSYGAYAKIYVFLKHNSSHKMVPENNLGAYWAIFANQVPGWPVLNLCTPTQYYFTMPSFHGYEETEKIHDLSSVANVKPYINFWVKDIEAGGGTDYVLLCKDNKSPFVKITKGEYLQLLEMAIPRLFEKEKKKIYEQNKNNQRSIDYLMNTLNERNERFITGLNKTKEKYKNRLGEIALTNYQPSVSDLEFGDVFSSGTLSDPELTTGRVPVYKIDPEMAELCKKDKPQWILVSWQWSPLDRVENYMHKSIINNLNFEYIYNFFFDPGKVKGQPYKPLRSPLYKEEVVFTEASEASKKNLTDKNTFFFEDFSTTALGKTPTDWRSEYGLNGGFVENPDGLNGNWLLITGNTVTPRQLKKPLPQNFTLSYELVASQDFTWGAKGLTFQLSKETSPGNAESYLKLKLRPGFDGKDGEATLETKFPFPPGYSNETKWLVANGFSNNKKNNQIKVTIKKTDETLHVFIDDIKIADYEKAIPAAHLFNAMSFSSGNSAENDKYYISNIKISKD